MMRKIKFKSGIVLMLLMFVFFISNAQKQAVKPKTKQPQYIMHIVKFGETLSKIAKKYDVSVTDILKVNPSVTANNLNQEQILRIPNIDNKKLLSTSKSNTTELIPKDDKSKLIQYNSEDFHTVLTGETMYSISKLYGIKVTDIQKWNNLSDYNLKIGSQIIIVDPRFKSSPNAYKEIPIAKKENTKPIDKIEKKVSQISEPKTTIINSATDVKIKNSSSLSTETKLPESNRKYHTVLAGETMYSISKLNGIKVTDIQNWNNISNFDLTVGKQIIVSSPKTTATTEPTENTQQKTNIQEKTETKTETTNSTIENTKEIKKDTNQYVEKTEELATDNETQSDLAKMYNSEAKQGAAKSIKGTGAPMTTTLGAMENVYFAMHKTLPFGTIIKIKNMVNSKVIYAKVIGKLPDTDENKHVIVRYTLGIKNALKLQNGKCYVQIEYFN